MTRKRKRAAPHETTRVAHRKTLARSPFFVGLLLLVAAGCTALVVWRSLADPPSSDVSSAPGTIDTSGPDPAHRAGTPEGAVGTPPHQAAAGQPQTASQPGRPPARMPRTARELVMVRQYYDQAVWADELTAQDYELTMVALWDALIWRDDKYQVLKEIPLQRFVVGSQPAEEEIDWGIRIRRLAGPGRQILGPQWPQVISSFQDQGFVIGDTEWRHPRFDPPRDGRPARSVMSVVMHVEHPATSRRFVIKAHLKIQWATAPRKVPSGGNRSRTVTVRAKPGTVEATDVTIIDRQGEPPFREQWAREYERDATGRKYPSTIHPVILHDLDEDGLPEIVVGGYNLVYWNQGNWRFKPTPLCDRRARNPNVGLFADFTGDGVTDYLCGTKSGFPHLFEGQPGGKFPLPGKILRIAEKKLPSPTGLTAGDIDHDGDLDVFVAQQKPAYHNGDVATPYYDANDSYPSYLLENDGRGNFRDVTIEAGLGKKNRRRNFCTSFVDMDEDGDLDLMLSSDFAGTDLFYNDGYGKFTDVTDTIKPHPYAFGMSHTFGDYNLDGRLDFLLIGMSSAASRRLDHMGLARDDFPEYNKARTHMGYGNRLYLGGQGGFVQAPRNESVARTGWTWAATTFDFDADGDQDIYCTNGQFSGKTTRDYYTRFWCHDIYYRRGQRPDAAIRELFQRMAPLFAGNGVSWGGYEHNALLMNLNGKDFLDVGFLMGAGSVLDSRCTVSGDLDGDGRVDLIVEHKDLRNDKSILRFLRNRWAGPNRWIGVHLRGKGSRPSALGARVSAKLTDGRTLLQHNVSGHAAWAKHANTIHFGLGESAGVDRIDVRWPDGAVSEIPRT